VGPIENIVAFRIDLSGGPSFTELLTRTRDIAEEAFSHQDVPFEVLLEELPLDRDLSRNPLFQVAFRLCQVRVHSCWPGGVRATAFEVDSETERFDLSLDLTEVGNQSRGSSVTTPIFLKKPRWSGWPSISACCWQLWRLIQRVEFSMFRQSLS